MNTKYAKLVNDEIEFAPASLKTDGGIKVNPTCESYLAAGWKKVVDEAPAPEAGKHVEATGWAETATEIVRQYVQADGERGAAGPRIFSKLKMLLVLKRENLWVLTKTWIEEHGLYDFYLAAQAFSENNEYFIKGRTELQRVMGKTDAEIEALLAECLAD